MTDAKLPWFVKTTNQKWNEMKKKKTNETNEMEFCLAVITDKNPPPANDNDDLLLIWRRNGELAPRRPCEWTKADDNFDVGLKYGDMLNFRLFDKSRLFVLFWEFRDNCDPSIGSNKQFSFSIGCCDDDWWCKTLDKSPTTENKNIITYGFASLKWRRKLHV